MALLYLLAFIFIFVSGKLGISLPIAIVWLEVNFFGRTYLPEGLVIMQTTAYIMWRLLWWKSLSKIRVTIKEKVYM